MVVDLQGIFKTIATDSTASASNTRGHTHEVCFGSFAMLQPCLIRSIPMMQK